jgi:hypothetical protein
MMQVGERATKIGFRMLTVMASQAISTMEDSVKLIPIFGEGYMILQNMIDMSGSAVSVGQGTMRYYSDLANAYTEISDSLGKDEKYNEDKQTLREVMKEIYDEILKKMDEATNEANNFTSDYADTREDEDIQNEQKKRREEAQTEETTQTGGSIFKKGGNAKTLKNRLGGSNNLTRRNRL